MKIRNCIPDFAKTEKELFKTLRPSQKALHIFLAKLLKTLCCLLNGTLAFRMALAIELVGVAHHLFFERCRRINALGKRKSALTNTFHRQPRSGVSLTNTRNRLQPFGTHQLRSQISMQQIGFRSMTVNAGSIGQKNSHIVKHRPGSQQ